MGCFFVKYVCCVEFEPLKKVVHNQRKADNRTPVNPWLIRASAAQALPSEIHSPWGGIFSNNTASGGVFYCDIQHKIIK